MEKEEIKKKLGELEESFTEYKSIIAEAYDRILKITDEYNRLKERLGSDGE